ncbi:MAG: N-acetyl-gamma-glutamyl-phosphate reductase [Candidatus Omnitrophica bacterium]|nr:N-acetyl-gamma-glutamyl-phosphate reductase [Candidatus Omnitrophota bacterium]
MMRCAIVGLSGYTGKEVFSLLLNHPQVRVSYVAAQNTTGPVSGIWPEFLNRTSLVCQKFSVKETVKHSDIVFLALPHTESMKIAGALLKNGLKVIDLSADYRLKNTQTYESWYGHKHVDAKNIHKAVYGLPELYRQKIKKAGFIANPGCYPTAAILGLAPLVATRSKSIASIIVDAKSGVSGAGRKASVNLLFSEVADNFMAYKVLSHQHTPEIDQCLSQLAGHGVSVHFVAHLLPMDRGILETMYVQLKGPLTLKQVHTLYTKFYKIEPFVRVHPMGAQPEVKNVAHTNFCDIGLALSNDQKMVVITSVLDNLVKGAAGQAIQNMNIMCGFHEIEGLL